MCVLVLEMLSTLNWKFSPMYLPPGAFDLQGKWCRGEWFRSNRELRLVVNGGHPGAGLNPVDIAGVDDYYVDQKNAEQ